ncbi:hypothetical protein GCM10028791_37430 [Echinicola sediminis]
MKKLLLILGMPLFLLVACQENRGAAETQQDGEAAMREEMPQMDSMDQELDDGDLEKKEISIGDLPEDVTVYISKDSLLSMLKLETVQMVTKGETRYYDLTFITEDSEEVIVSFDDKGNILEL